MSIDIFSGGGSSIENLIATTIQIEAQPRFMLQDKVTALSNRRSVLSELDSKLSSLNSFAKKFTDSLTDYFAVKAVSTTNSDIFTASATEDAQVGNHDIAISRVATADTRVSNQYTSTGTSLGSFFSGVGSQTFNIDVGHPTSGDSENRESIGITINPTGSTDDEILDEVALAINTAMADAVSAQTIDSVEQVFASVVHETGGSSRLIFRSGLSGYTHRQTFTDSANSLLSELGINNAALTSGATGGYTTEVGTSELDSELNSELTVDGLTYRRDSNSIDDILDGVTMTIKNTTTSTEELKVEVDTESMKKLLQEMMDSYNGVISFLKAKSSVNSDTGFRGELAGDTTYSFLKSTLRGIFGGSVDSVSAGNPENLSQIGIKAATDGTLSFSDESTFEAALTTGSAQVSDLFNSSNGIAVQLEETLNAFIKVGGTIDDSKSSLSDRIKTVNNSIGRFDDRLARREVQLREQFGRMQEIAQLLSGQSIAFSSLAGSIRY